MRIQSIIVDDEPLARKRIKNLLSGEEDIDIIGEAGNGLEAVDMIIQKEPNLVFLDIQMPELNGFGVIEKINKLDIQPQIIFTTAYDKFAINAFEVCALDYLLKPFDKERFQNSLDRARRQIAQEADKNAIRKDLKKLLRSVNTESHYISRIMIKSGGRISFVRTSEIYWIKTAGNYIIFHTADDEYMLRETMNNMEKILDPATFIRTHRTAIVNIDYVRTIEANRNDYVITLQNRQRLPLSRKYREKLSVYF